MKFGRTYTMYVQTEVQRWLPECPYVEFKQFKKLLKRCPHLTAVSDASGASDGPNTSENRLITECEENLEDSNASGEGSIAAAENEKRSSCSVCDAEFFPNLDKAVSDVVGCFNARAKELLRLHMASGIRKFLVRLSSRIARDRDTMIQLGNALLSYGCMNALAVRKILKKYDKVHGSEAGRAFRSRLQLKRVELLQSPLLIELGALAVNLMDSKISHGLEPGALGYSICNFDDDKKAVSCVLSDGLRMDFDLTCSICLDVVFDPVGLGCGHIFCTSCACAAASVPTFLGVSEAKKSAKCPLCRQARVYAHARRLEELYTLINNRCSVYYAERLPLEREQRLHEAKQYWDKEMAKVIGF